MAIFKELFKVFKNPEEKKGEGEFQPEPKGYSYAANSPLAFLLNLSSDRKERYEEYEKMMEMPYIAAAAKIYADECCQRDPDNGKIFNYGSKNPKAEKQIKELFERVKIEEKCPLLQRNFLNWETPFGR